MAQERSEFQIGQELRFPTPHGREWLAAFRADPEATYTVVAVNPLGYDDRVVIEEKDGGRGEGPRQLGFDGRHFRKHVQILLSPESAFNLDAIIFDQNLSADEADAQLAEAFNWSAEELPGRVGNYREYLGQQAKYGFTRIAEDLVRLRGRSQDGQRHMEAMFFIIGQDIQVRYMEGPADRNGAAFAWDTRSPSSFVQPLPLGRGPDFK